MIGLLATYAQSVAFFICVSVVSILVLVLAAAAVVVLVVLLTRFIISRLRKNKNKFEQIKPRF